MCDEPRKEGAFPSPSLWIPAVCGAAAAVAASPPARAAGCQQDSLSSSLPPPPSFVFVISW